MLKWKALKR